MPIFKKNKKLSSKTKRKCTKPDQTKGESKKINKMIKIGFGHKDKKKECKPVKSESAQINKSTQFENNEKTTKDYENVDAFLGDLSSNEERTTEEAVKPEKREGKWSSPKKRRTIIPKDMKGKPVYLEDTGEKLGIVFDMIYDGGKNLIGYKIKDNKSDAILSFPIDQFDEDKNGLIFIPSWYSKAMKTLEKLEFKERVSPELTTLLTDDTISNEELYNIFVKHDDQMAKYIEEAVALKELLNRRVRALEKQRLTLKDDLMDLTEKRLIKDIDRRAFSEDVMEHRRKVTVLDVNIKKCKELLRRLDHTSFGMLGKHISSNTEMKDSSRYRRTREDFEDDKELAYIDDMKNPYRQKYHDLKERFEQLEEEYDELKGAVGKLIAKNEL